MASIRLQIDASEFDGWENIAAFTSRVEFIRNHEQRIERITIIAGRKWQRWVIASIRMFLQPEVRAYDQNRASEALQWVVGQA